MDSQIVINWPRHHNLPTEPGWYLIEGVTGNTRFVKVELYKDENLYVLENGEDLEGAEHVLSYSAHKWSDKIDL